MKRLLIITYYWPPSGGSGVQRWLKFAKYLPKYGWQPVIFTPKNPDFSIQDEGLNNDIPTEAEIVKYPISEPYSAYRKLLGTKSKKESNAGIVGKSRGGLKDFISKFIRGNVFIPDPKVSWVKPSTSFLLEYLQTNPVDAIVSTGPPHSMHLIALGLKKHLSMPWIADFRDPWSELDMLASYHILPFRYRKYKALEERVLKKADVSLTVSKVWASDFERLGAKKTAVITNGFDPIDFEQQVEAYPGFVISHFGLLNHLRNPNMFWLALAELCEENPSFNSKLKLHFGGTIDDEVLAEIRSHNILKDKIKLFPYLSHNEVINEYMKSSVLLLLLFNSVSGRGNIPGKLFEYIASEKPILAIGSRSGDSEEILKNYSKARYFDYSSNVEELKQAILELFKSDLNLDQGISQNNGEKYSRDYLTKKLSGLIESML